MQMKKFEEIDGNLITLAKEGKFDVIAHGCNCFCTMGAGLAPQMAKAFGADKFPLEAPEYEGSINKLGTIDYDVIYLQGTSVAGRRGNMKYSDAVECHDMGFKELTVVNVYSQFGFGSNHKEGSVAPLDYDALTLALRKMNHIFRGKHIGLPAIGAGLAGGDINIIRGIITKELKDCYTTLVIYSPQISK